MFILSRYVMIAMLLLLPAVRAEETSQVIMDFESEKELKCWSFYPSEKHPGPENWSEDHVTSGKKSLKLVPGNYMRWQNVPSWAGYDALDMKFFVDGEEPVELTIVVADKEWDTPAKRVFNNRHNLLAKLRPGANTISLPVNGMFRGEVGARNLDIKHNIDPSSIVRFDIGVNAKSGKVNAVFLDEFRLTKEGVPPGILAFDFGPESQPIFPGFKGIAWNTVYGKNGNAAGLRRATSGPGNARDSNFPSRLYQDFIEMPGNEFIVDLPNGKYGVWVMFTDTSYWIWEVARFTRRTITVEGKLASDENRGPDGPNDSWFRFEPIEPHPGDSLWELYMKDLFTARRFDAEVNDGQLNLEFAADNRWSACVSGVIIFPEAKRAEAEKWIAEVEKRNRQEFEDRAVFLGPKPKNLEVPAQATTQGWWLGFPALEDIVTFTDAPGKPDGKLSRATSRGQAASFTFAIRPLKDFTGAVNLACSDLTGPAGKIDSSNIELRYVHHNATRGFGDISYNIEPETLRRVAGSPLKLAKDLTRQFLIAVNVPSEARGGTYSGQVTLSAQGLNVQLPLTLEVYDFEVPIPDFDVAFYGMEVPGIYPAGKLDDMQRELFRMMVRAGMNALSGGPSIKFSGFDENGIPKLDFAPCDRYFRLAKECGITGNAFDYSGPGGVTGIHDQGAIGAAGKKWSDQLKKPFSEVLKTVFGAIEEHAKKENWPKIYRGYIDEPRVVEQAQSQLELLRAYRDAVPEVLTGGYYSVNWKESDALHTAIQDLFKTMAWSGLNGHSQIDIDKAKEFGRQLFIYNQSTKEHRRFSFGPYQWAEMRKGVRGRLQWHTLAIYSYQFFNLDGREPDAAMVNYGRNEIIPTLGFYQSREGAYDFRYACLLTKLAEQKSGSAEGKAALEWLEQINRTIAAGERKAPAGFMDGETFRAECVARIQKLVK